MKKTLIIVIALFVAGLQLCAGADNTAKEKGYAGFVELGYGTLLGETGINIVDFSTIHGYKINPYFFVGAGTGVSLKFTGDHLGAGVPLFLDARANLMKRTISPFVDFRIGYYPVTSAKLSTTIVNFGEFFISPTIGVRFPAKGKVSAYNLGIGYTAQRVTNGIVSYFNHLNVRFAIEF